MMKKYIFILAIFAGACGHVNFDPPKGFVETQKSSTILRLVAADASAIRVTHRENKKNGSPSFWATLMERELTEFKGYKLEKKTKFKSTGFVLEMRAPYKHKNFHYTVGILAGDDDLYIVELGCENAVYAAHKKSFMSLLGKIHKEID
ncbi:hypothetical protein KKF84_12975 [Myxococcota bacterium]|nr:hypothetical protein [Myxococcota bacterium]